MVFSNQDYAIHIIARIIKKVCYFSKKSQKKISLCKLGMPMNNILSYLDWRGDLTPKSDPLNEVDNLIFSVLAYFDYEGIVPQPWQEGSIPLSDSREPGRSSESETSKEPTRGFR